MIDLQNIWKLHFAKSQLKRLTKKIIALNLSPKKKVTFKKYALLAESLTTITTPVFLTTSDPSLPQLVIKKSVSINLLEISHLFSCSLVTELIHLYISARVALTIAHWSPSKV